MTLVKKCSPFRNYHRVPAFNNAHFTSFDELVNDFFKSSPFNTKKLAHKDAINIIETDAAYLIEAALPGVPKSEVKIQLKEGILSINYTANTNNNNDDTSTRYIRRGFVTRNFNRSFYLPDNTDTDNISATHNNGILQVSIPKKAPVEAPTAVIDIK